MNNLGKVCGLAGVLAVVAAQSARADGSKSWNVCGGNTFNTCASVSVSVVGRQVTMQVWNLSGTNGTYGGTVFTGVGVFNLPSGICVATLLSTTCAKGAVQSVMSGPVRSGDNPAAWWVQANKQIGGGVQLDLVGQTGNNNSTVNNGIAGNCLPGALPGGSNQLWMDPTCGTGGISGPGINGGFAVFSFYVNQTWDPSSVELLVKGQNGPNGQSTQCITGTGKNANCGPSVVPEPVSIVLVASGLLGLGGVGGMRRRRKDLAEG